jgi:hypothetical protein
LIHFCPVRPQNFLKRKFPSGKIKTWSASSLPWSCDWRHTNLCTKSLCRPCL